MTGSRKKETRTCRFGAWRDMQDWDGDGDGDWDWDWDWGGGKGVRR